MLKDGTISIVINGLSKHFDIDPSYKNSSLNQRNYGLGFEYDFPKQSDSKFRYLVNVGEYRDSLNGTAVYAGGAGLVDIYRRNSFGFAVGMQAAAFHSAKYNNGNPFVALLPVSNIGTDQVSVNIVVIPRVSQFMDAGVVFAQLKLAIR